MVDMRETGPWFVLSCFYHSFYTGCRPAVQITQARDQPFKRAPKDKHTRRTRGMQTHNTSLQTSLIQHLVLNFLMRPVDKSFFPVYRFLFVRLTYLADLCEFFIARDYIVGAQTAENQ